MSTSRESLTSRHSGRRKINMFTSTQATVINWLANGLKRYYRFANGI
jgi:hypothetical protein